MSGFRDADQQSGEIKARLEFPDNYDLQEFFQRPETQPLVGPDDLERIIPRQEYSARSAVQKASLQFVDQYWVQEPYAFASIWRNERHEEYHYYAVEPTLTTREERIVNFLDAKLLSAMDLNDQPTNVPKPQKKQNIGEAVGDLMDQYNMWSRSGEQVTTSLGSTFQEKLTSLVEWLTGNSGDSFAGPQEISGDESARLSDYQAQKILYYIWRDHVWFGPITPLTKDPSIEDIACNGYETQVFIDHSALGEQVATNVVFGEDELDDFVVNLAQRSGKSISKRQPAVDATLENGSRLQLTLGTEVSDEGTTFTIRQFRELPFTPIDLLHWETMSLEHLVYLWFAIENNMSAIVAGGTASGKTTSLNALTLFIPSTDRIVSIEDTRELTLAQSNHVPLVTRESSARGDTHDIGEYDLLEYTLRMRPDYIAMGEVRGEEARDLFQAMNTGHTTYTTFHSGSADQAISRFTSDPLNVESPLFGSVDLILHQELTTTEGERVRRLATVEEIVDTDADDDLNYKRTFNWDSETDTIHSRHSMSSPMLERIKRKRGWSDQEFRNEWERRKLVLAYLSNNNIDSYAAVAAILQAYMSTPATVLSRMADGTLKNRIEQLDEMVTIDVNMNDEREEEVPRPGFDSLSDEAKNQIETVVSEGRDILEDYRGIDISFAQNEEEALDGFEDEAISSPAATESASVPENRARQPIPGPTPDSAPDTHSKEPEDVESPPVETQPIEQSPTDTDDVDEQDERPSPATGSAEGAEDDDRDGSESKDSSKEDTETVSKGWVVEEGASSDTSASKETGDENST